jgi:signal peptidase I
MKPTIEEGDRVVVNKLAYDLKVPFTLVELMKWSDPSAATSSCSSRPRTVCGW